ncbi:PREDICTED: leucine-rich repeat-containing protein 20 isoform X2 [Aptenodytes forsteri]|uniref:leucine-rich repeat-containing protein 20 isoform X2 n=1 Tax=Aptenodytes forsteri TaxID=9233 RepID=UPI0004F3F791|nr:PREDICTED: leucine-rich repeat-containing protein 20 isoform X2 [Aptenodytes forsteri]
MQKRMGEAVARVARKVNDTVENKTDSLAMRSVTEGIHNISLANNELKSLTSRFVTTFSQLRELNLAGNYLHRLPEEVTSLLHLRAINLSRNRFRHFPEPLAAVATLETIDLEENEIAAAEEPVSGFPSASLEEAGRSWYPPKDAEVPVEKLATMASLRSLNLRANPVGPEVRLLVRPLIPFDLLLSPEEPVPKA